MASKGAVAGDGAKEWQGVFVKNLCGDCGEDRLIGGRYRIRKTRQVATVVIQMREDK